MSHKIKILHGAASNVGRMVLSMLISLLLPPLLVHRLSPAEYGAWVLILQIGGYITLLDLGVQTAIGKFVAEYEAAGDAIASARTLSSSFVILCASASLGGIVIALIAWRVPQLFQQMPIVLIGDVRAGILLIGLSLVFALPFNAFLAVFTGLQRYGFPTVLAMSSRALSACGLAILLLSHGTLIELACLMAVFNIMTALGQYVGWRVLARTFVRFSFRLVDRASIKRLVKYGSVLSVWSVALLFVSGLDLVIVGHYDFRNTGYYGIASSATNFMVLVVASIFGPLLPAISSLQLQRTIDQMGDIVVRTTRYCTLVICSMALPLALGAFPILKLWVGADYARHSTSFLEVLIVANAIRQLGLPYSLAVVGTGRQHLATLATVAEAVVNVCVSIYLVQHIGALGVAIGTLVGAFVSIGMHFYVSMKQTNSTILISRRHLLLAGLARPLLCVVPTILLLPFLRNFDHSAMSFSLIAAWGISTVLIALFVGLSSAERRSLAKAIPWGQ